jgi:rubrerythrin
MDDYVRVIFDNAVIREKAAQRLYHRLAGKAGSKRLRDIFIQLMEEEKVHERLFSKMNTMTLKIVNAMPLRKVDLAKSTTIETPDPEEFKDMNAALNFAIGEEDKAISEYSAVVDHLEDGKPKETISEIIKQEIRHKLMLIKAKEDLLESMAKSR